MTILCTARLDNNPLLLQDAYTVYPVTQNDTHFIMTTTPETNLIVILPLQNDTRLNFTHFDDYHQLKMKEKQLLSNHGWMIKRTPKYYDAVFNADKPIAVYIGRDWIKASVRPWRSWAKTYMAVGPEDLRNYYLNIYSKETRDATVKADYNGKNGQVTDTFLIRNEDTWYRGYQVRIRFNCILITSNNHIAIAMSYTSYASAEEVSAIMVPTNDWLSSYVVCVPYNRSEIQSKLTILAHMVNFPKIQMNGEKLESRLIANWETEVIYLNEYLWAVTKYDKTVVFTIEEEIGPIRPTFIVYLQGYSQKGSYYTEAGLDHMVVENCDCPCLQQKLIKVSWDNERLWWYVGIAYCEVAILYFICMAWKSACRGLLYSKKESAARSPAQEEEESEESSSTGPASDEKPERVSVKESESESEGSEEALPISRTKNLRFSNEKFNTDPDL